MLYSSNLGGTICQKKKTKASYFLKKKPKIDNFWLQNTHYKILNIKKIIKMSSVVPPSLLLSIFISSYFFKKSVYD